VTTKRYCSKSS